MIKYPSTVLSKKRELYNTLDRIKSVLTVIKGNCSVLFHIITSICHATYAFGHSKKRKTAQKIGRHKTHIYELLPVTNYTYLERPRRDLSTYAGRKYIHAYPNKVD